MTTEIQQVFHTPTEIAEDYDRSMDLLQQSLEAGDITEAEFKEGKQIEDDLYAKRMATM